MAINIYDKYGPRANQPDGDFPTGSVKNESLPDANDGTPLDKDQANDRIGADAALFAEAGITPSGNVDTATQSDRLDALKAVVDTMATYTSLNVGGDNVGGDNVGGLVTCYLRSDEQQVTYSTPISARGEVVVDVTGDILTTDVGTYKLESVNKSGVVFRTISDIDELNSVGGKISHLLVGDTVIAEDYGEGNLSGTLFFKVVAAGTGVDDGGKYIDLQTLGLQLEQNMASPVNVMAFGALGNGSYATNQVNFNAAASYCKNNCKSLYVPTGTGGNKQYVFTGSVQLYTGMKFFGDGNRASFLTFVGANGVEFENNSQGVIVEDIAITTNNKYPVTGDTYTGIYTPSDGAVKCEYNQYRNVFLDGWGTCILVDNAWNNVFTRCYFKRFQRAIRALGRSTNNTVDKNNIIGDLGATNTHGVLVSANSGSSEGWMIHNNLIDSVGKGVELFDCSHNYMTSNIIDHCENYGVLWSSLSSNQIVTGNYIAVQDGASVIIAGLNETEPGDQDGHNISQNELVPYGTVAIGMRMGGGDTKTRISYNALRDGATTALRFYDKPVGMSVTNNNFSGQPCIFDTLGDVKDELVVYENNDAVLQSSSVTIKTIRGANTQLYRSAAPASGYDAVVGDTVENISAGIGDYSRFKCVEAGNPGVWGSTGLLS